MANQTPTQNLNSQYHAYWGVYTSENDLPNRPGNIINTPGDFDKLQEGDVAYVVNDSTRYVCTSKGTETGGTGNGDAVWVPFDTGTDADHQTAKTIVGNAPAGDSDLVCDILDLGDGAGIASALARDGDVYLRPGTYDFGLPGSPALPLAISANQALRGPNIGAPISLGGDPLQAPLLRTNPDDRRLFTFDHAARIENIGIEVVPPNPGATGTTLIDGTVGSTAAPRFIENVLIVMPGDPQAAADESLTAVVRSQSRIEFLTSFITVPGPPYLTGSLVGLDGPEINVTESEIFGIDQGLRWTTSAGQIRGFICGSVTVGVEITGGASSARISTLLVAASSVGLRVDAPFLNADNLSLFPTTPGVGTGLLATSLSDLLQVNGVRSDGWSVAMDLSAPENRVGDAWVEAVDIGLAIRSGALETQVANCNSRQDGGTPPGTGAVGYLIEAGASECILTNCRAKEWDTGLDNAADDVIYVACNFRGNTTPVSDTGAGTEAGHNKT